MKTMFDYIDELWFEYLAQDLFNQYLEKEVMYM